MDRGDNLAGVGSLNGIFDEPSKSDDLGRPADLIDFQEFLDTVFGAQ
jgi:hypothetical protein